MTRQGRTARSSLWSLVLASAILLGLFAYLFAAASAQGGWAQ